MKGIIALVALAIAAFFVVIPIVFACLYSPWWLLLECGTFPAAVVFYVGAMEM